MSLPATGKRIKAIVPPALATSLCAVLTACSGLIPVASPTATPAAVTGNWQFASSAPEASQLPSLAGALTGTTAGFTGILHPAGSGACVSTQTNIPVSGTVDAQNNLTLTSAYFAGGSILTVTGALSPKNVLTKASVNVTGGACAFPRTSTPIAATGTQMAPISGTYQGTFLDSSSYSIPVTATLSQTSQPDSNGVFHLSGYATFPGNSCLTQPAVTDSTVTGAMLSTTYTQGANTVVASGTFNSDATILTIANWTISGPCGPDNGTGTLTHQ